MESVESLGDAVLEVEAMVAEAALEPDGSRGDWSREGARLSRLGEAVRERLLARLGPALQEARSAELRASIGARVALALGDASAVMCAAGEAARADGWLKRAAEICPDPSLAEALSEARGEPLAWAAFGRGRFLMGAGKPAPGRRSFEQARKLSRSPALRALARSALDGPRPITSVPPLFRLNGCGAALYGRRDEAADGSYVATYCVCIFFVPVLPLTAYRVKDAGSGSYLFSARERLGPVARVWQAVVGAAAIAAVGIGLTTTYLESPEHRSSVAMREASALEASGDRGSALERYRGVIESFGHDTDVSSAAVGVVRVSSAAVAEPCAPSSVEAIGRVVAGFLQLPGSSRAGAAESTLLEKLLAWAEQIGARSPEAARASLAVLDMAAQIASPGEARAKVDARRVPLRKAEARRLEADRPVDALARYARVLDDAEALSSAEAVAGSLGPSAALWVEAEPQVQAVATALERSGKAEGAKRLRERVGAASEERARSEKLVESGDEPSIARALAASPKDETLASHVALSARRRGDAKGCLAALGTLGPPGRLSAEGQILLGGCQADAGDLALADAILTSLVDERRPGLLEAQRAYGAAVDAAEENMVARARRGELPSNLTSQLRSASEAEQPQIFRAWVVEQLGVDVELARLKDSVMRQESVVAASLELGAMKLRRASEAGGEERKALLAGAEQAFVSIRNEAEGAVTLHLGLGQVYHRLGKPEQGDAELGVVLERKLPESSLEVAHVYRELGLEGKARPIALGVYQSDAPEPVRHRAASLLAHLAGDLDEKAVWLGMASPVDEQVKLNRLDVEAERLLRDGKRAEAERAFARLASEHEGQGPHSPAALNNAALAHGKRFAATGDAGHLRAAASRLEQASRLAPDNALVTGNHAASLSYLGVVQVLDRWVQIRTLSPAPDEARSLAASMLEGPLRAEVLAALGQSPAFRRSLEAHGREQILAPTKAVAYAPVVQWLRWSRDAQALAELRKRVEALPSLSANVDESVARAWLAGEHDDSTRKQLELAVAASHERVARAQQAGHKPTLAAALAMHADDVAQRAWFEQSAETLAPAIEGYRRAAQLWPEGGFDGDLVDALVRSAVLRAAEASPALKASISADRRELGSYDAAFRAATGPASAEVLAALRAQPALAEAARRLSARPDAAPEINGWVLAVLAGDKALEARTAAAFARRDLGDWVAIEQKLYPTSRATALASERFARGPRPL